MGTGERKPIKPGNKTLTFAVYVMLYKRNPARPSPMLIYDPQTTIDGLCNTRPGTTLEFARQVIDAVKLIQQSESKDISTVIGPQVEANAQASEKIARASKLEVKEEVQEVYVPASPNNALAESAKRRVRASKLGHKEVDEV